MRAENGDERASQRGVKCQIEAERCFLSQSQSGLLVGSTPHPWVRGLADPSAASGPLHFRGPFCVGALSPSRSLRRRQRLSRLFLLARDKLEGARCLIFVGERIKSLFILVQARWLSSRRF